LAGIFVEPRVSKAKESRVMRTIRNVVEVLGREGGVLDLLGRLRHVQESMLGRPSR